MDTIIYLRGSFRPSPPHGLEAPGLRTVSPPCIQWRYRSVFPCGYGFAVPSTLDDISYPRFLTVPIKTRRERISAARDDLWRIIISIWIAATDDVINCGPVGRIETPTTAGGGGATVHSIRSDTIEGRRRRRRRQDAADTTGQRRPG